MFMYIHVYQVGCLALGKALLSSRITHVEFYESKAYAHVQCTCTVELIPEHGCCICIRYIYIHAHTYTMYVHMYMYIVALAPVSCINDKKARQRYTPRTAFSFFEKTALGGI